MKPSLSPHGYRELIEQVHDVVSAHVRPGSVVLFVSRGDEALVRLDGYRAWHFPRDESGIYAGHYPASSVEAIAHLRRLYAKGAQYLVFPWTARWWLDHYTELATHLETAHRSVVVHEGVCVIYELQESPAFGRWEIVDDAPDLSEDGNPSSEVAPRLDLARPRARVNRVLTVLARFGTASYPNADTEIADIFSRQMPGIDRTVVIVDNALPLGVVHQNSAGFVIGGDNHSREFSAFDRAIEFVGSDIWRYDLVHLATSAFNQLHVAYLDRFDAELLDAVAGRAICVGHIDCYNEPIEVLTYHSQHWVRSCFFVLPPTEVKALGSFASVVDRGQFFSGSHEAPFLDDAPLSTRYRGYITEWLTGGDIGQGVKWHSSFALTPQTLPEFEQKVRAILNEQLLGIRLRALGCHLVDVTWLSTMLRHKRPSEISWTTPWREQLATRDRDRVIASDAHAEDVGLGV
jgi:hypothetical protein